MSLDNQQNEYRQFRTFLQDSCGILLGDNKAYLVNSRLKTLLSQYDISNMGQLIAQLSLPTSQKLREHVIDAMTTNETLWFRDGYPFDILKNRILSEVCDTKGNSSLRIWSAACSTGQEPYSISMAVKEFLSARSGRVKLDVKVTATDIAPTVLDNAKMGTYQLLALGRGLSDNRLKKFFSKKSGDSWEINQEIKSMVDFKPLNLLNNYQSIGANFDVIFCRNVLIYFSPELKREILIKMHKALKKGGYLILGASESLTGLSDYFDILQCRPGIIYRAK